jgi:hypothetical protein
MVFDPASTFAAASNSFFATASAATEVSFVPVWTVPSALAVSLESPSCPSALDSFSASTLKGTAAPAVVSVQMVRVLEESKISCPPMNFTSTTAASVALSCPAATMASFIAALMSASHCCFQVVASPLPVL